MSQDPYLPGGMTDRDLDGPDDRDVTPCGCDKPCDCDGPVAEKYQVRVFDRLGTHEMNDSAETASFDTALIHVRKYAAKYPTQDYVVQIQNDKHTDEGFDGLTDEERERCDEAIEQGKRDRLAAKAAESGKRSLDADPELKDIDGRIRSLEPIRAQFTDPTRPRWSVLNDLHRELSALMRVVQRASGRRS